MIWKCVGGGTHEGQDCYEEFGKLLKHTKPAHDVPLVRLPERNELLASLSARYPSTQFFDEDIDAILETLVHLTPTGEGWSKLFRREQ